MNKKILFLTYNFSRPEDAGVPRPFIEINMFKELGYDVSLLTAGTNYLTGKLEMEGIFQEDEIYGVKRIRTWAVPDHRTSIFKRLLNYLSYSFLALYRGLREPGVDVVFLGTDPIFVTFTAYFIKLFKGNRVKLIIDERDIFPDTAIVLGVLSNKLVIKAFETWEKVFRKKADAIIAATPGIKRILEAKKLTSDKITVIPNFDIYSLDKDFSSDGPGSRDFRKEFKRPFIALYAGALGLANDIPTILKAAAIVKDKNPDIAFVIIGSGERITEYRQHVKDNGIDNTFILDGVSRTEARRLISQADLCIHALKNHEFWHCALSSKIFDYIILKKPIVYSGFGDIEDLLENSGGGTTVPPENPEKFAAAVLAMYDKKEQLPAMGQHAFDYVVNHYSPENIKSLFDSAFSKAFSSRAK